MGVEALWDYIQTHCAEALPVVNLFDVARKCGKDEPENKGINIVIDAEGCPDRLYGGYYNDWVCGGQWNRTTHFLNTLVKALRKENIEVMVMFNGAFEPDRLMGWYEKQLDIQDRAEKVFPLIEKKHIPPSKALWVAPSCNDMTLRFALRHLNVQMACTMDDHLQEVIGMVREGLIVNGESGKEVVYDAMLGESAVYAVFNPPHLYSAHSLKLTFRNSLDVQEVNVDKVCRLLDIAPERLPIIGALLGGDILLEAETADFFRDKLAGGELVLAVISYVRSLPSVENLAQLGRAIFQPPIYPAAETEALTEKFVSQAQYFANGTEKGFLQYMKPLHTAKSQLSKKRAPEPGSYPNGNSPPENTTSLPSPSRTLFNAAPGSSVEEESATKHVIVQSCPNQLTQKAVVDMARLKLRPRVPKLSDELIAVAAERHARGLSSPWIHHLITAGEVKLSAGLETWQSQEELPQSVYLYRPVRQYAYALLFDVRAKEGDPDAGASCTKVAVREWYVKGAPRGAVPAAELVHPRCLDWQPPSLKQLWLGRDSGDWLSRMKAFLSCFRADAPLMLSATFVQPHQLILCCVLRYMLSSPTPVLYPFELDAFLAQACSPMLHHSEYLQHLQLSRITCRGIQLATIFMKGVEHAIFVNEVCGVPVQWECSCPWLFFDGKLFHQKLLRALNGCSLYELADGDSEQLLNISNMRQAIMDHLQPNFAKPKLNGVGPGAPASQGRPGNGSGHSPFPAVNMAGRGRPMQPEAELRVAGEVVGHWAGGNGGRGRAGPPPMYYNYPYYQDYGWDHSRGRGFAPRGRGRGRGDTKKKEVPRPKKEEPGLGRGIRVSETAPEAELGALKIKDESA